MPRDDEMSKVKHPHKPAGVTVHLGPGFQINKKTGKVEKVPGYGLDTSAKIRQKKSKRVRVVKKGKT